MTYEPWLLLPLDDTLGDNKGQNDRQLSPWYLFCIRQVIGSCRDEKPSWEELAHSFKVVPRGPWPGTPGISLTQLTAHGPVFQCCHGSAFEP